MPEKASVSPPMLVSLLICDQVIDDRLSNKKSAIGLFNTILVSSLPTQIHQAVILASLTEIAGRTPLELRLVRDTDNAVLFRTEGHVDAPNPLATVDLVFAMHGVQLAAAGPYAFEVLCQGELLGRRRFQVLIRKPGAPGTPRSGGPTPSPDSSKPPHEP